MSFLNDYLLKHRDAEGSGLSAEYAVVPRITCEDGFSISVQANSGAYCLPRDHIGTWSHVECGFPSDVPTEIMDYIEDSSSPTSTVYGYVPIELVEALIARHGGIKEAVSGQERTHE